MMTKKRPFVTDNFIIRKWRIFMVWMHDKLAGLNVQVDEKKYSNSYSSNDKVFF